MVTPDAGKEGNITVDVAAAVAVDANDNPNTPATQAVQAFDTLPPALTITDDKVDTTINSADGNITYTFTFSQDVTGFTAADITVANGTKGTFAGSGSVYTLVVTPDAGKEGNITVDVSTTDVIDSAGNQATAPAQYTQAFDTLRPTIAIASNLANLKSGETASLSFTLSEASTDFNAADLSATGGTLSNFSGSGTSYTATFTPDADSIANAVISVASSSFSDHAGNTNNDGADSNNSVSLNVDSAAPSVLAVRSTTANGTYGVGDTITIEVQFTDGLVITGSPRLQLETGSSDQVATFTGLGKTAITNDTLTFTYIVQIGDSSADLDQSSVNALDLVGGGTLKDAAGNDAILTLALPGTSGSLAANGTLIINTNTNNTGLGQNGADHDYERDKDINGDKINDDLQPNVTTFLSPGGPSSVALKTVVLNQHTAPDNSGSVVANTLLFFDKLTSDSSAITGLQLSVSITNPGTANRVTSTSDLINFTVTPNATTTGDVRGLNVTEIRDNAIATFESTIQEVDIYFPESTSGASWNALYKTRKAQNNSIEYYLFNYDPLTGLGGILLDRDGINGVDGARLYLKDGELGDFDEVVNGRIEDPIGFTTLSETPTLRISGDGKGLTVDGVEGTGLWITLAVSSFSSSSQSNLEMYNNVQPLGAIGATLGSGPTGSQAIYLAAGSSLSFRSSEGAGNSSNNPALSISSSPTGYSLGLDADRNGTYTDLMLDISSSIAASSPASLAIARKQLSSSDAILDLTSIAATGITLTLDISTDCGLRNRFGFVKLDPLTGTTYQVNGISQSDTAAFRSAILSQFVDPYQGTSTSHRYGQSRQTISWALDSSAAGYYAPVMITQGGEVLTFGSNTASDGRQHVKLLGTNTFGFEDLLASQGSDWDFNDTKIRVSVA